MDEEENEQEEKTRKNIWEKKEGRKERSCGNFSETGWLQVNF